MNDKPIILNLNTEKDDKIFNDLKSRALVVDEIKEQIKELELVKNPELLTAINNLKPNNLKPSTIWVYYPWRNMLVHCLNKEDFHILRMSRNKNIITEDEQKKLEKFRVGVAGLNVGNPGAVCLALEGDIEMKLTDNDVLSLSNLNRFRAGLPDLGINKAVLTARQIYEINPFARVSVFPHGIAPDTINQFLTKPKIDLLIEEMDNLKLKIEIRERARRARIPVLMVTGNGPNVI